MSVGSEAHDDPGTRTRWAWLRTLLTALAVVMLVARGIVFHGSSSWLLVPIALGVAVVLCVGVVRAEHLRATIPAPLRASSALVMTSFTVLTSLVAIGGMVR